MNEPDPIEEIRRKIASLDVLNGNPFLVLGHMRTNGTITGGKYPIHPAMATRLRGVAAQEKARAAGEQMYLYDGATVLHHEEGMWVPGDRREGAPLLQFLENVDDVDELTPTTLQSLPISFYAIGFGPDDDRVFFVRQSASRILGTTRILGVIEATMRPLNASLISLDATCDFILTDVGAAVFGAAAFERFIQDPVEVAGHFEASLDDIALQLPFNADVLAAVKAKGSKSTMLRGRVRSIMGRPYFADLTLDKISEKIAAKGLDPKKYIDNGQFVFHASDTMFVLKLLDQKVWLGDFDETLYSTNAAALEQQ